MRLVFLAHPAFLGLRSQDAYARMLMDGCAARGHQVELRSAQPRCWQWLRHTAWAKWGGYVDQYLLFPRQLKRQLKADPPDTLYVVCDQALGPWVPSVAQRPHVVHCHDLLALASALGEVPENPTRASGRLYQRCIRRGFAQARHFISISAHTRSELHRLGLRGRAAKTSVVVLNGLNHPYTPLPPAAADAVLQAAGLETPAAGWLLHVGGGQWYKNTAGVVALYGQLVRRLEAAGAPVPLLLMVSPTPGAAVRLQLQQLPAAGQVRWLHPVAPALLHALYARARALLFPSLAEGYGWPVAEALACGCPVVCTGVAPLTEVGGDAPLYLPRLPGPQALAAWAADAATAVAGLLNEAPEAAAHRRARGLARAAALQADNAIDRCLAVYEEVLRLEQPKCSPGATVAPGSRLPV
ncbi:glycosyltransferase [Rubrivivax rivuli]|uniref:Glycosyltransferase n=1 Tax=Rubrivivax rivuli TaxID=1862385 RepID=A0A437REB2_9BURK|nr:glycosyltransferase [Rubrivivax rivuli]RVU45083.1 glycosyltransferase [Rubrivivax rivuli]